MPQQGSLTQEMELADEPWTGERGVDSFWKTSSAHRVCREATPRRKHCCVKRARRKREGSCSEQFLITSGPPDEVPRASVRFTPRQAPGWHVLFPFYTWRYMTCLRLPACVLQRCDGKSGPTAPVYTFSIWTDPLLRTWDTKNRNETVGNDTMSNDALRPPVVLGEPRGFQ